MIPRRVPVGRPKEFDRFFTVTVSQEIFDAFQVIKERTGVQKTEIARRLYEYFLTLPCDSQDRILMSFEGVRERRLAQIRAKVGQKTRKPKTPFKRGIISDPPKRVINEIPNPAPVMQIKRSGLP